MRAFMLSLSKYLDSYTVDKIICLEGFGNSSNCKFKYLTYHGHWLGAHQVLEEMHQWGVLISGSILCCKWEFRNLHCWTTILDRCTRNIKRQKNLHLVCCSHSEFIIWIGLLKQLLILITETVVRIVGCLIYWEINMPTSLHV